MRATSLSYSIGASLLLLASSLSGASAVTFALSPLYQCESANLTVTAEGNFTVEARDNTTRKIVFRDKLDAGVTQVAWDVVDLASNTVVFFEVTDQTGNRRSRTTSENVTTTVLDSGNSTCLNTKHKATSNEKSMVATIIGVSLGAFFLLLVGLIGLMVYRRKKERRNKTDNDSVDDSHRSDRIQPGEGYMAKLVPGLNFHAARPLPRDIELENEQAKYADERRITRHYTRPSDVGSRTIKEQPLPSYGQSQRQSRMQAAQVPRSTSYYNRRNDDYNYLPDASLNQQQAQTDNSDPFDSRNEQHHSLYENDHRGWDRS